MKLLLGIFLLCIVGCSVPQAGSWQYVNPDQPDPLQTLRAKADCQMYIDASRQETSLGVPRHPAQEWEDEFVDCMAARGWRYLRSR